MLPPVLKLRWSLVVSLLCLASGVWGADTRADFLAVIAKPRVPLAPEVGAGAEQGGLVTIPFSFAADAEQRVPGILIHAAKRPSGGPRRPVIIAMHGTGGKKESQAKLLGQYAALGFIGVAIDARYHGARVPADKDNKGNLAYNEAVARAYRTGSEHPFFYDTVWDVMRLIDWLATRSDVDAARIGLIGFSKGGIETYLAAAVDTRIAVAVPCIGVQSFGWALEHGAWPSRVETVQKGFDAAAAGEGVAKPDAAFARKFYDRVVPGIADRFDGPAMLPLIAPRPLLVINGDSDKRTPVPGLKLCLDAAAAAYARAGAEEKFVSRIQPDTGHRVNPDSHAEAKAWFVRWLQPSR